MYTEIRINSKLAEEKYFLDDRQISMLINKKDNNIYEFSLTILQESQNGTTHFSEYVEIILCLILDLNAQNDWVKTTSIIPTDSISSFIILIKLY